MAARGERDGGAGVWQNRCWGQETLISSYKMNKSQGLIHSVRNIVHYSIIIVYGNRWLLDSW